MKTQALILIAVGMLFIGAGIAVTAQKIFIPECNYCSAKRYRPGYLYQWVIALSKDLNCQPIYNPNNCIPTYYIIPLDLFAFGVAFSGAGLVVNAVTKQPPTKKTA